MYLLSTQNQCKKSGRKEMAIGREALHPLESHEKKMVVSAACISCRHV